MSRPPPPSRRPKRALGQNFLVDGNIQRRIVDVAAIEPDDAVVEIGPGRGALTGLLAERAGQLTLVELDDLLAAELEERFRDIDHVRVLHADILETRLSAISSDPSSLRVIGNIPYNITTPILFHLLEAPRPADILLMVQKEVAERIAAVEGTSGYGALSVGVQTVAEVETLLRVPPGAFRPRPRVDSAVIRIRPIRPFPLSRDEEHRLRRLTRAAFQWRRKQLRRTLRDHPDLALPPARLERLGETLDLERRPETLSPTEFVELSRWLFAESPESDPSARRDVDG
ncbi:MAG: ribosomal RNA small subunit methyltransferase A [Gemmatimonadales bacterium]|nr:MAG: ribosomal RNA small subunit methyltransferase A [Gemmatimonadales bacterium]